MKCFLFVVILVLTGTIAKPQASEAAFRIVGYYSLEAAQNENPKKVPFKKLTHINLWFLNPDTLGNFVHGLSL